MKLLRALLVLALALAVEVALGRFAPAARGYVDVLMVPVAWYGIARSARAGMLCGCAAGLLQDAWFETSVFGLHGFVKTLLGFVVGGIGGIFDLNQTFGRFGSGALMVLVGRAVEIGLLRLLDAEVGPLDLGELAVRAVATGLLLVAASHFLQRVRGEKQVRRRAGS